MRWRYAPPIIDLTTTYNNKLKAIHPSHLSFYHMENPMKVVETLVKCVDRLMTCVEKHIMILVPTIEYTQEDRPQHFSPTPGRFGARRPCASCVARQEFFFWVELRVDARRRVVSHTFQGVAPPTCVYIYIIIYIYTCLLDICIMFGYIFCWIKASLKKVTPIPISHF